MKRRMTVRSLIVGLLLALAVPAALAAVKLGGQAEAFVLESEIPIGGEFRLGGLSDLYPQSLFNLALGNRYYSITDRGPNTDGDVPCDGDRVVFVPGFTPRIVALQAKNGKIEINRQIELHVGQRRATGLPNLPTPIDEVAFDSSCTALAPDVLGFDTEGIVLDLKHASFWVSDEYRPSIARLRLDGEVLSRIVPEGSQGQAYAAAVAAAGLGMTVDLEFPAIVAEKFRRNRGFEGIAISEDGKKLYTLLQSAMRNPNNDTQDSRAIRVFELDISNPSNVDVTAEWVHLLDNTPDDLRISALVWAGPRKLIIEERDDEIPGTVHTHLHVVDFNSAANVLGGPYDQTATVPTLEQIFDPDGALPIPPGLTPGAKTLFFDLDAALAAAGFSNGKIEGITVQKRLFGRYEIAALNDNDFNFETVLDGNVPPIKEQLDVFRPASLP